MTPSRRHRLDLTEQLLAARYQQPRRRTTGETVLLAAQAIATLVLVAMGLIGLAEMAHRSRDRPPEVTLGVRADEWMGNLRHQAAQIERGL